MLLSGIDWKSLPPDRLINVLSALVSRYVAQGEGYMKLQAWLFDDEDFEPDPEELQREYEESLDENGLPKGLRELPKG